MAAGVVVGDRLEVWRLRRVQYAAHVAVALILLIDVVLLLGWVEDLAAKRPVRALPWATTQATASRSAARPPDAALAPAQEPATLAEQMKAA